MKKDWIFIGVLALVIVVICLIAFGYIQAMKPKGPNPVATITIKDFGEIKVELYPDVAPNTVANFISLANSGFYDGLTFHRTIPGFMIQGGDKNGDGSGSADYSIRGEFLANGTKNTLKHTRGVISMARSDYGQGLESQSYNSASTQFFIMTDTTSSLDNLYGSFGKVIEGMDVVDSIADVEVITREETDAEGNATSGRDKPVNPPVIESIKVDTFGVDYGEPKRLEPFDYYSYIMQQYGGDLNYDDIIIPEE